jgi:hypothetical protein
MVLSLVIGIVTSLIAAAIAGLFASYRRGRKRGRQDADVDNFYKAMGPVMTTLRDLRNQKELSTENTRRIVTALTQSFSASYLGSVDRLPIKRVPYRQLPELRQCDICAGEARIQNDTCIQCKLDCCAWDTATMPHTPEEVASPITRSSKTST